MGDVTTRTNGFTATLTKSAPASPYGDDIKTLLLNVTFETAERLRVRITDPAATRYEVPIDMPIVPGTPPASASDMLYKVTTTANPFGATPGGAPPLLSTTSKKPERKKTRSSK